LSGVFFCDWIFSGLTTQSQLGTGEHGSSHHPKQTLFPVGLERLHPDDVWRWDVESQGCEVVEDVVSDARYDFFCAFASSSPGGTNSFLTKSGWDLSRRKERLGPETKETFRSQLHQSRAVDTAHPPGTSEPAFSSAIRPAGSTHGRGGSKYKARANRTTTCSNSETKLG
jgi:hypothetical protein